MAQTLQQLFQSRPSGTSAASVLSPSASEEALVKTILVCNTSSALATFRIFHDDDGTTYDENTALYWDIPVPAGKTAEVEVNAMMNSSTGNLAVRSNTADALTFTGYGSIVS